LAAIVSGGVCERDFKLHINAIFSFSSWLLAHF
jgi:hypothetical protein